MTEHGIPLVICVITGGCAHGIGYAAALIRLAINQIILIQVVPRDIRDIKSGNKQRPVARLAHKAILRALNAINIFQLTGICKGHIVQRLVRQIAVNRPGNSRLREVKVICIAGCKRSKGSLVNRSRSSQHHLLRIGQLVQPARAVHRQRPRPELFPVFIEQLQRRSIRRVQLGRKPLQARSAECQRSAGQFNAGNILPNGVGVALQRYIAARLPIRQPRIK